MIPTVGPRLNWSATLLDRRPGRRQALHFSFGVYIGLAQDPKAAEGLFEKAATSKSPEALYQLGRIFRRREGGLPTAVSYLRRAVNGGHPEAQAALVEALGQDPTTREEALGVGRAQYAQGNYHAGVEYANLLLTFGNTPLHPMQPVQFLNAAALRDVPAGQLGLARLHLGGTGGAARDPFEATRWLIALVNHPEARVSDPGAWAEAHRQLADCYRKGVGVPKDTRTADRLDATGQKSGGAATR